MLGCVVEEEEEVSSAKSPETLTKCIAAQIQLKFLARKAIKVLAPTQQKLKLCTEPNNYAVRFGAEEWK